MDDDGVDTELDEDAVSPDEIELGNPLKDDFAAMRHFLQGVEYCALSILPDFDEFSDTCRGPDDEVLASLFVGFLELYARRSYADLSLSIEERDARIHAVAGLIEIIAVCPIEPVADTLPNEIFEGDEARAPFAALVGAFGPNTRARYQHYRKWRRDHPR